MFNNDKPKVESVGKESVVSCLRLLSWGNERNLQTSECISYPDRFSKRASTLLVLQRLAVTCRCVQTALPTL
jgi:hypothetical protein